MKPSEVLKEALQLIQEDYTKFACLAIGQVDEYDSIQFVGYWREHKRKAMEYLYKQKPRDAKPECEWWPLEDKQSRIEALQRAITDAESNGE